MRAGFICSNPVCRANTVAAAESDDDSVVCLGKAAHIAAAAAGGPRFDAQMLPSERASILNAIYLCAACADLIDKNGGADYSSELLQEWKGQHETWVRSNLNKRSQGIGGEGGSGIIVGNRGTIIGGKGGDAGVSGFGGNGGSGLVLGDDGVVIGGDGGSGATADGRGGRAPLGPTARLGFPTGTWGFGAGGIGANAPEYNRRLQLLMKYCDEFKAKFPERACFVNAGIDRVPLDWINQRLIEENELWSVDVGPDGYVLPPLL
jgi:hypothetical protein